MSDLGGPDGRDEIEREFLRRLYDRTGGDTWMAIAGGEIGEAMGLRGLKTSALIREMAAQGWLRPATRPYAWPLWVRITPLGIHAVTPS